MKPKMSPRIDTSCLLPTTSGVGPGIDDMSNLIAWQEIAQEERTSRLALSLLASEVPAPI
jgi:hypothetical protein